MKDIIFVVEMGILRRWVVSKGRVDHEINSSSCSRITNSALFYVWRGGLAAKSNCCEMKTILTDMFIYCCVCYFVHFFFFDPHFVHSMWIKSFDIGFEWFVYHLVFGVCFSFISVLVIMDLLLTLPNVSSLGSLPFRSILRHGLSLQTRWFD